jgi:hypothetical protein
VNENFCWVSAMVTLEAQQQQQQIKYNRQQMSFLLGLAAGIGA